MNTNGGAYTMVNGTVKFYNDKKKFGFIKGDDGVEYFVHESGLVEGTVLKNDDAVTFDVVEGEKGAKAGNVKKA